MREPRTRRYPTDLSNAERAALEPLLPPPSPVGWPPKWPRRPMAEAIFYLVRSGCAWLSRSRRLARDHERLPEIGEAMILAAMTRIMLRRPAARFA